MIVNLIVLADGTIKRRFNHLLVTHADHNATVTIFQRFHSRHTEPAGQHPVETGGLAATLNVAKNSNLHLILGEILLHRTGQLKNPAAAITLSHHNNAR